MSEAAENNYLNKLLPEWRSKLLLMEDGVTPTEKAIQELTKRNINYKHYNGINIVFNDSLNVNAFINTKDSCRMKLDWNGSKFVLKNTEWCEKFEVEATEHYPHIYDPDRVDNTILYNGHLTVSIVNGCTYSCRHCNLPLRPYGLKNKEITVEKVKNIISNPENKVDIINIIGGAPAVRDKSEYISIIREILKVSDIPVDLSAAPWVSQYFGDFKELGLASVGVNVEVWGKDAVQRICPQKHWLGMEDYLETLEQSVSLFGKGNVRSLLLVGLEELDKTLEGVEAIAKTGADPILIPFRPTHLKDFYPPTAELMARAYVESQTIAEKYGVALGPRNFALQHNAIAFPTL